MTLLLRTERDYAFRAGFNRNDLYRIVGGLGVEALSQALTELARRHQALRTTFGWESGQAVQKVYEPGQLPIRFRAHDFTESKDSESAARSFIEVRLREPFDARSEALVRADFLRVGPHESWLLTSMHQLVSDGRSAQIFADELLALAKGFATGCPPILPSLPLQPKDVAAWRHRALASERKATLRAFWGTRLAGATTFLELATDRARPAVATLDGKRLSVRFPDALAQHCENLCGSLGITEFVLVNTAVTLLLMGCMGKDDVTVGTYVRGRDRLEFESLIGFFINTVPLRLCVRTGESIGELLARAQSEVLQAFDHQAYPYGWTMGDLGWERGVDRSPVFDVMVALDDLGGDERIAEPESARMDLESLELPLRRAKEADLLFAFGRLGPHLELALTYNTDIISEERARRYLSRIEDVLGWVVSGQQVEDILALGDLP